jgi:hypothetical protein
MNHCHLNNIKKVEKEKKITPNHIGKNKNLQFFKKWTYILHNENSIAKYLLNIFLNAK